MVATLSTAGSALAATNTWDASGASPATPTDGIGSWNTTTGANWSNGISDAAWNNGDIASIGSGGAAGTITIDDGSGTVTAAGINFNAVGSGNYTIAASGANTLTLTGAAPINLAAGVNPTISAPIAGSGGLTLLGTGALNLSGNNTLSGTVSINSGTLAVGAGGNLGATTNAVTIGTAAANTIGSLTLGTGVTSTIGSLACATSGAGVNTIAINAGATLNINSNLAATGTNGVVQLSSLTSAAPQAVTTTNLTISGAGLLSVTGGANNSSFVVGVGNTPSASTLLISPTLDMSGLANFSFTTGLGAAPTGTGPGGNEFAVGVGSSVQATVNLAQNSTITAGTVDVGNSMIVTPGSTPGGTQVAGTAKSTINFGTGTNVINANLIQIGTGKSTASVGWASSTTAGTLTIAGGAGGASTATIVVGTAASTGTNGSASSFDLSGHSATIQADVVKVGQLLSGSAASGNGSGGTMVFDNGTMSANSIILASIPNTSTGTIAGGRQMIGSFTLGRGSSSTGVLNATSFIIANNASSIGPAAGTFILKGGTANIGNHLIDVSTGSGTSNTNLTLSGGTLNMQGFSIGPVGNGTGGTRHITTITYPTLGNSATLMNLGGTGINDVGLTMNGTGTLILEGSNTYSGATTVSNGTLQVGQTSDVVPPSNALPAAVTNNATLAYGSSQLVTISSLISGSGGVVQNGAGTTTVTSNSSYTGPTSVAAGILSVSSIPIEGAGSVNSPLGASSNAASKLVLTGGTLQYTGAAANVDRLFTIAPTGGGLDASGSGAVAFNNGGSAVSADAAPRATTDSTSTTKLTLPSVYDLVIGMTVTGTNIPVGSTITAINAAASSITISALPTATGADTLSFSAVSRTLTLTGTNASANTMGNALSDSAGGGSLGLTKAGTGHWVLLAANTYTGNTNVNAGVLDIAAGASIAGNTINVAATGTLNVVGSIPATATVNNGGSVSFSGNSNTLATSTRSLAALNIATAATTVVLPSATQFYPQILNPAALTFADTTSKLDLTTNELITTGSAAQAMGLIVAGQLFSSSATSSPPSDLGYIDLAGGKVEVRFTLKGDADLNGSVDVGDLGALATSYGITGGMLWANGDFNRDSNVDVGDLGALATNYGTSLSTGSAALDAALPAAAAAVPEPSSLGLLGLAALVAARRRRR